MKNYFSWWIANLGVVPLFLLAAFLLEPILFFRLALLVFVIRVFETIINPLIILMSYLKTERLFLRSSDLNVKVLKLAIPLSICFCVRSNASSHALAIGGHLKIPLPRNSKFSIGNSDTLGHKLLEKEGKLLIKGKKKGFSEVAIWNESSSAKVYSITVYSKSHHLSLIQVRRALMASGLRTKLNGNKIIVDGVLDDLAKYNEYQRIHKIYRERIVEKGSLNKALRNKLITSLYKELFQAGIAEIECKGLRYKIHCIYDSSLSIPKVIRNSFPSIVFRPQIYNKRDNFIVELRFIQWENHSGREIQIGLSGLDLNLSSFFETNGRAAMNQSLLKLKDQSIQVKTIARPKAVLSLSEKSHFEVGSEIPIKEHTLDQGAKVTFTKWKFLGLKLQTLLNKKGQKFELNYDVNFSVPGKNSSFSKNRQKSKCFLELDRPKVLFEIGYQARASVVNGIPGLKDAPFFGNLFQGRSEHQSFKKISAVILLKKESE